MTGEQRTVVQDAEQERGQPAPLAAQDLARPVVEIEMPQGVDVVDLEAADFELFAVRLCGERPVAGAWRARTAQQTLALHLAAHGGVGRQIPIQNHAQVVVVQLAGPVGMVLVLLRDGGDGRGRQGTRASGIASRTVAQDRDRIGLFPCRVEPPLKGRDAKADR